MEPALTTDRPQTKWHWHLTRLAWCLYVFQGIIASWQNVSLKRSCHILSFVKPCRRKLEGGKLEVKLVCPALSFSFCFLSLCAWLKSPLGEPHSCCQATRLPGSRVLMNSHSVMEVALPTHWTQGQTGGQTHACVQTHARMWHVCSWSRQDTNAPSGAMSGILFGLS